MTRPYRLSPEGRAKKQAMMRQLNAAPAFAAAAAERGRERMRRLNAARGPASLAGMTAAQRKLYAKLRTNGIPKDEAIREAKRQ